MDPLKPGMTILGRWVVQERFVGGMGVVAKAADRKLNAPVALKVGSSNVGPAMFRREVEHLLGLEPHPNVVQVLEVTRWVGRPLIVMAFYGDGTLAQSIGSPQLLIDVPFTLRLALQICDAMNHMKNCGVLAHGDLKPTNLLMLGTDGVAVADFGLSVARLSGVDSGGTPEYMAPELWEGNPPSVSSDVYAFGALLFEMLTGVLPFGSRGTVGVSELRRRHIELPLGQVELTSGGLRQVIEDCLRKRPSDRPSNFEDLRARLAAQYQELTDVDAPAPLGKLDADAWHWTRRGLGLCALGRHWEERECHEQALRIDPNLPAAYSNLADNCRELGDYEAALANANAALERDPGLVQALDIRGSALDQLGDSVGAEAAYRAAIEKDAEYSWSWYNLGLLLQSRGALREAEGCYRSTVRLNPDNAQAWSNLGCLLTDSASLGEAEACFRQALEREPCLTEAVLNLDSILKRQQRHLESIELLERVERECQ